MKKMPQCVSQFLGLVAAVAAIAVLAPQKANADNFDWRDVGDQNWNTSVKNQFGGTCWDFAAIGAFESKYMLTRNDVSHVSDLSEQQLVWETDLDLGSTGGTSNFSVSLKMENPSMLNFVPTAGITGTFSNPIVQNWPSPYGGGLSKKNRNFFSEI
jgi:C1A family cysteine protease